MRFIDIPALLAGDDIFDRLWVAENAKRGKAVEKLLARMTKACAAHHGLAFEHYVAHLIANRSDSPDLVEAAATRFRKCVEHPATDTAMTRDALRQPAKVHSEADQ